MQTSITWIVAVILPMVGLHMAYINVALNDKFKHPLRYLAGFDLVYIFCAFLVALVIDESSILMVTSFAAGACCLLFLMIMQILKRRDVKGINVGEEIIDELYLIDVQTCCIIHDYVQTDEKTDLKKAITNSLEYILSIVTWSLGLDGNHKVAACILYAKKNKKFDLIAQIGIASNTVKDIQRMFNYSDKPVSLAGLSAKRQIPIIVNDLADDGDHQEEIKYWEPSTYIKKEGSILCYPIIKGVGVNQNATLAVICISSRLKNAFDKDNSLKILERFSPKIEALIYLYENLTQKKNKN